MARNAPSPEENRRPRGGSFPRQQAHCQRIVRISCPSHAARDTDQEQGAVCLHRHHADVRSGRVWCVALAQRRDFYSGSDFAHSRGPRLGGVLAERAACCPTRASSSHPTDAIKTVRTAGHCPGATSHVGRG